MRRVKPEYSAEPDGGLTEWGQGDDGCFLQLDTPTNQGFYVEYSGNCTPNLALVYPGPDDEHGRSTGFYPVDAARAAALHPECRLLVALSLWFRDPDREAFGRVARCLDDESVDELYTLLLEPLEADDPAVDHGVIPITVAFRVNDERRLRQAYQRYLAVDALATGTDDDELPDMIEALVLNLDVVAPALGLTEVGWNALGLDRVTP
jgi:hypothetical protein